MCNATLGAAILDRHPTPNVRRPAAVAVPTLQILAHQRAAFGQHLKGVPGRQLHRVKNAVYECSRYLFMKKVTHRVDKNHARATPDKRLFKPFETQGDVEAR